MGDTEAIPLHEFMSENWDFFSTFESAAEEVLDEIVRNIPADLHELIREQTLSAFIASGFAESAERETSFRIRLVIDTNIIVQDCFRVAKGLESSTERILSSPYLEVLAPKILEEEVDRNIRKKLPKGASLEAALSHAQKLLSLVKMLTDISSDSFGRAYSHIADHSLEDVPFLAIAIEHEVDAIVSGDKRAFDRQPEVVRWQMGEVVVTSVTYEGGMLSLFVTGSTALIVAEALEQLLIAFANALFEALEIMASLFIAIAEKSVEMLSRIPTWAWAVILAVGLTVSVLAIFHEEFGDWLGDVFGTLGEILAEAVESVIKMAKTLWEGFKTLLIWIWNLVLLPVVGEVVILAGVLFRRIWRLLNEEMKRATGNGRESTETS